jgi:hypothetical protein
LRFFKEPIFVWTDLPDDQCNVILTYIIGAILPVVALLMTSMVTNYLNKPENDDTTISDSSDKPIGKPIETNTETIEPTHIEQDSKEEIVEEIIEEPKKESKFINLTKE